MTTGRINQVTHKATIASIERGPGRCPLGGELWSRVVRTQRIENHPHSKQLPPTILPISAFSIATQQWVLLYYHWKIAFNEILPFGKVRYHRDRNRSHVHTTKKIKYHCWNSGFQQSIQPKRKKKKHRTVDQARWRAPINHSCCYLNKQARENEGARSPKHPNTGQASVNTENSTDRSSNTIWRNQSDRLIRRQALINFNFFYSNTFPWKRANLHAGCTAPKRSGRATHST